MRFGQVVAQPEPKFPLEEDPTDGPEPTETERPDSTETATPSPTTEPDVSPSPEEDENDDELETVGTLTVTGLSSDYSGSVPFTLLEPQAVEVDGGDEPTGATQGGAPVTAPVKEDLAQTGAGPAAILATGSILLLLLGGYLLLVLRRRATHSTR